MNTSTSTTENFIMVVPCCSILNEPGIPRIRIEKLCYWHDGECEHPVNDGSIGLFLRNANLYNVSVYPEHPHLGCYAMDNDIQPENGEIYVQDIYYKGNLIYCNCQPNQ